VAVAKAEPTSVPAHYLLGTIHEAMYDRQAAAASFRESLQLNPHLAAAQVRLSRLELLQGDVESAVALASAALNGPGSGAARLGLGRAQIAQRDISRAERTVTTLLRDYPNAAPVHTLQGSLQLAKRDLDAARKAFERGLQLHPQSVEALTGLVWVDVLQERVPAARERIDARLRTDPNRVELLLLASQVSAAAKDLGAAERTLRRVIQLAPSEPTAYTLLSQVYLSQGKLDAAKAEFDQIATRNSRDVGARLMSALIVHAQQNIAEAEKRYEQILEMAPKAAMASNNLAWILAENGGDLDRALRLATTAVEARPEDAGFNDTFGWVYLKKNLPLLAVEPFERAVRVDPANPVFHYHTLGLRWLPPENHERRRPRFKRRWRWTRVLTERPTRAKCWSRSKADGGARYHRSSCQCRRGVPCSENRRACTSSQAAGPWAPRSGANASMRSTTKPRLAPDDNTVRCLKASRETVSRADRLSTLALGPPWCWRSSGAPNPIGAS